MLAGLERFLVEFIRRNDAVVAGLTQPQLISIAMIVGGGAWIARRTAALGRRAAPASRAARRRAGAMIARRMAAATADVLPEDSAVARRPPLDRRLRRGRARREHGTPAYVVAEDDLRARARAFTGGAGRRTTTARARSSSPPRPALHGRAARVRRGGAGCDVASGGELHLALHAGFAPERIYLHGNAKSEAELAMAVEAGIGTIVLDNAARGGSG